MYSVKRNVDETLCFAAIVPDYKLLTEAARAALPKEVSHKDAVYIFRALRWCPPPSARADTTCWPLPPRISCTSLPYAADARL